MVAGDTLLPHRASVMPSTPALYPPLKVFAPFRRDGVWKTRMPLTNMLLYLTFTITF